ncbi:hypothetical protein [Streptomyces griseoviridis]|uniref:DUF218 domain-containing protein n=1 Tax=Streptomyces griseoviridis TaxID=45398 RepID=A0ABT9LE79_STRGD|nr:hypothetical protein [Streptomyces griseoviridis]MDP9682014.1 hypothetical protein [Streptomyces griseoviridis]GGT03123.1 hypothetical protein GCM10010240_40640 [Streptomyces griseoviridis]
MDEPGEGTPSRPNATSPSGTRSPARPSGRPRANGCRRAGAASRAGRAGRHARHLRAAPRHRPGTEAPHTGNGGRLLAHRLGERAQCRASAIGGGSAAREDIGAAADAVALAELTAGVEVLEPDRAGTEENLTFCAGAWKSATGG